MHCKTIIQSDLYSSLRFIICTDNQQVSSKIGAVDFEAELQKFEYKRSSAFERCRRSPNENAPSHANMTPGCITPPTHTLLNFDYCARTAQTSNFTLLYRKFVLHKIDKEKSLSAAIHELTNSHQPRYQKRRDFQRAICQPNQSCPRSRGPNSRCVRIDASAALARLIGVVVSLRRSNLLPQRPPTLTLKAYSSSCISLSRFLLYASGTSALHSCACVISSLPEPL